MRFFFEKEIGANRVPDGTEERKVQTCVAAVGMPAVDSRTPGLGVMTLTGTNISHLKVVGKMIFLSHLCGIS